MNAVTEEEARKRWCPMARSLGRLIGREFADEADRTIAFGSQNRGTTMGGALDNCRCLASDCMMWRWKYQSNALRDEKYKTENGYCGLARSEHL